mmetsp:Transcript_79059/g.223743  ORF Transcript_79059/g.223743 Transcript_79059/m.223743 type:complete len:217 (+) Transcript_79059:229-879(+)
MLTQILPLFFPALGWSICSAGSIHPYLPFHSATVPLIAISVTRVRGSRWPWPCQLLSSRPCGLPPGLPSGLPQPLPPQPLPPHGLPSGLPPYGRPNGLPNDLPPGLPPGLPPFPPLPPSKSGAARPTWENVHCAPRLHWPIAKNLQGVECGAPPPPAAPKLRAPIGGGSCSPCEKVHELPLVHIPWAKNLHGVDLYLWLLAPPPPPAIMWPGLYGC